MEEVAKSLKLNATVVIAASATLMAFLISPPNGVERYREARDELIGVRSLLELKNEYKQYAKGRLNQQRFHHLQEAMTVSVEMSRILELAPKTDPVSSCRTCIVTSSTTSHSAAPPNPPPAESPKPASCDEQPSASTPTEAAEPVPPVVKYDDGGVEIYERNGAGEWRPMLQQQDSSKRRYAEIEKRCFEDWGNALQLSTDVIGHTATVADCHHFLMKIDSAPEYPEEPQVFIPHLVIFAERFRELLSRCPGDTLVSWRILPLSQPESSRSTARAPTSACSGVARLICEFKSAGKEKKSLCTTVSGGWACGMCASAQLLPFHGWCAVEEKAIGIVLKLRGKAEDARQAFLPHAHKVWSEVSSTEVDEAISSLDNKIVRDTEKLTLFGFSASSSSASIAFPWVVGVILVICAVQLDHLDKRLVSNSDKMGAVEDSWFAFHSRPLALVISILLMLALPNLVFWWLLSVAFTQGMFVFYLITSLFLLSSSIYCTVMLVVVRRNLLVKPSLKSESISTADHSRGRIQGLVDKPSDRIL